MRTAESASPLAAPAVGASLVAFVIVYFAVFGMGSWYLLKLMSRPPQPHEPEPANAPAHAAGITPAPALAAGARPGVTPMADTTVLTLVWAAILAFAVFMYVVMDGFDLGIGVLFPVFGVGKERDTAMNSIAPVWDGNETWLVLGGGGLLAAFPLAYSVIMSALYAPLIAMLLALVFRGVAFEFRWRDPAHRAFWDLAFTGGSLVAAFTQGIMLGALLQGVQVEGRAYAGGWWDWLTPFSLLTGASVVAGYSLVRRVLAQLEDRGRDAGSCATPDAHPGAAHARRDSCGQSRDAVARRSSTSNAGSACRACCSPRRCRW